jgi:soluble lytic murein transglycosylase-like protein
LHFCQKQEFPINRFLIPIFAVILGSLGVQNESAVSQSSFSRNETNSEYLYMNFSPVQSGSGLMGPFNNPSSRAAVIQFLEKRIGNKEVAGALIEAADRYQVDPALVVAVSWQESRFQTTAAGVNRNSSVDRGLMQLNSATFTSLSEEDFYNPYLNADHGTSYLRQILDISGNTVTALAMYNAGPGRVGSLGAPRMTLEYIDRIYAYRDTLVREFLEEYNSGGVLIARDIRPVKNPDYL